MNFAPIGHPSPADSDWAHRLEQAETPEQMAALAWDYFRRSMRQLETAGPHRDPDAASRRLEVARLLVEIADRP